MQLILYLNQNGCRAKVIIETNDLSLGVTIDDFILAKTNKPHHEFESREYNAVKL